MVDRMKRLAEIRARQVGSTEVLLANAAEDIAFLLEDRDGLQDMVLRFGDRAHKAEGQIDEWRPAMRRAQSALVAVEVWGETSPATGWLAEINRLKAEAAAVATEIRNLLHPPKKGTPTPP